MRKSRHIPRDLRFYTELSDFKWVADFVSVGHMQARQRELKAEAEQLNAMPRSKKEYMQLLKKSYDEKLTNRVSYLKGFLGRTLRVGAPFDRWSSVVRNPAQRLFVPLPSWGEIEEAVKGLTFGELPESQKEKSLSKIEKELSRIQKKLKKIMGQSSYQKQKTLVSEWQKRQSQIDRPCTGHGVKLDLAPKREQVAWEQLGLEQYCHPQAPYTPADRKFVARD